MISSPLSFFAVFCKSFVVLFSVFSPLSFFAIFSRTPLTSNQGTSSLSCGFSFLSRIGQKFPNMSLQLQLRMSGFCNDALGSS